MIETISDYGAHSACIYEYYEIIIDSKFYSTDPSGKHII